MKRISTNQQMKTQSYITVYTHSVWIDRLPFHTPTDVKVKVFQFSRRPLHGRWRWVHCNGGKEVDTGQPVSIPASLCEWMIHERLSPVICPAVALIAMTWRTDRGQQRDVTVTSSSRSLAADGGHNIHVTPGRVRLIDTNRTDRARVPAPRLPS